MSPSDGDGDGGERARLHAWVSGRVQGVGFRWFVCRCGNELGLSGTATNLDDGRVEIVAQGARRACEALLAAVSGSSAPGRVDRVNHRWAHPQPGGDGAGFVPH